MLIRRQFLRMSDYLYIYLERQVTALGEMRLHANNEKGSLFGPYTPLQQLDLLADHDTKSYVVGSTNSLLLAQRDRYSDILINVSVKVTYVITLTRSDEPGRSLMRTLSLFRRNHCGKASLLRLRTVGGLIF